MKKFLSLPPLFYSQSRNLVLRKRFYKNVTVSGSNGNYEIALDMKKLKTPSGAVLSIPNQTLALAVAQEWDSQKDKIRQSQMHLTSLCNTSQDNPARKSKEDIVEHVMSFLETDTLLFKCQEPEQLCELQTRSWDPVVSWFNDTYNSDIESSLTMMPPDIKPEVKDTLSRTLRGYNYHALTGFSFGVEALKSIILMLALVNKAVTVEGAVSLSRLELEFQIAKWGNVEWSHDLDLHDTRSRVAAAAIFVHLTSNISEVRTLDKAYS